MKSLIFAVFLAVSTVSAAQTSASLPSPVQDISARSVLEQAGHALAPLPAGIKFRNYALTGTIQLEGTPGQHSVKILSRSDGDLRFEIEFSDGTTHSVVIRAGHSGRIKGESGREMRINNNALAGTEIAFLPTPAGLAELAADARAIDAGGAEIVAGRTVHRILLTRQYPKEKDPLGIRTERSKTELLVDTETFFILRVRHLAYGPDANAHKNAVRELEFSDYREVSGCWVPFQMLETLDGQRTWTISVSSIELNPNLTDLDFKF